MLGAIQLRLARAGKVLPSGPGLARPSPASVHYAGVYLFPGCFFRADSLTAAGQYFAALFGANGAGEALAGFYLRENLVFLAAGVLFAVPFAPWLRAKAEKSRLAPVWSVGLSLGLLALFVVCSSFLIQADL